MFSARRRVSSAAGGSWPGARARYGWLCLWAFVWVLIQLACLHHFGVRVQSDSPRYLSAAAKIVSGDFPSGKASSYLGYDCFVAAFEGLGLGVKWIAAAQCTVAFIALTLLYGLGARLYDHRVGLTAVVVLTLFPDASYWHGAILADSLYSSMIIISSWLLISASSILTVLAAAIVFCFTCTIRPHGVGFAVSGVIFLLCRLAHGRRYGVLAVVLVCLAFAAPFAWEVLGSMAGHEDILHHYVEGTVIWGYSPANIAAPAAADPGGYKGSLHPVQGIAMYLVKEPAHFWALAWHRIGYFLLHTRPYFAVYHNLSSLLVLLPAYAFALWSLVAARSSPRCAKVLLVSTLTAQTAIVAVTFADWDGRHLIPVLSIVFLLASAGFWNIVDRRRRPARRDPLMGRGQERLSRLA